MKQLDESGNKIILRYPGYLTDNFGDELPGPTLGVGYHLK